MAGRIGDLPFPGGHAFGQMVRLAHGLILQFANFGQEFVAFLLLLRGGHFDEWLVVVVEESEELVILAL